MQALLGRTQVDEPDVAYTKETWDQSRSRWRTAGPTLGLTWGEELTGEAFVSKAERYASFDGDTVVLEVGPGYGRILRSFLERGLPFKDYYAIDISQRNIDHLREHFAQPNIHFLQGDIEVTPLPYQFDVGLASLTFKHLYPSFEASLGNCARHMAPGGVFLFDLLEGTRAWFEQDRETYIRYYTKPEVTRILDEVGLELIAFDEVVHARHRARLLVAASKLDREREP